MQQRIDKFEKENQMLRQRAAKEDASKMFRECFQLSSSRGVGFRAESQDKVTNFLLSLNSGQQSKFQELMNDITSVELGTRSGQGREVHLEAENQKDGGVAAINKRANEMMLANNKLNKFDALTLATKEYRAQFKA